MPYSTGSATSAGSVRPVNQDCLLIRTEPARDVCLAAMCDGMGGFSAGEEASGLCCALLDRWFTARFCGWQALSLGGEACADELEGVLRQANHELVSRGCANGVSMGTTASVLLIMGGRYHIVHVGDSRIYQCGRDFYLLTQDDNAAFAGSTAPGAQNILTQCVGVNAAIAPHRGGGASSPGDMFFLCCDGMYHTLSPGEIRTMMTNRRRDSDARLSRSLETLIDSVVSRGERDNISGILIGVL